MILNVFFFLEIHKQIAYKVRFSFLSSSASLTRIKDLYGFHKYSCSVRYCSFGIHGLLSLELDVFFSSKIDFVDFLIRYLSFYFLSPRATLSEIKNFYRLGVCSC